MSINVIQGVSIAPAVASDCRECSRLLIEQLAEHGVCTSTERLQEVLKDVVADSKRGFLMLARENGEVVGIVYAATIPSVEHGGLVAWLEELYVVPSHRCRGIGTALVRTVLERAREVGVVAVDLEIDETHDRVQSLYRRFDFRRLPRSRWVRKIDAA